jgi:two-component system response regulator DevR
LRRKIRVFILDDHELVRRGLRVVFESAEDIELVGECESAPAATQQLADLRPDVAILDDRLPDGSGIGVCRQARSVHPNIHVILLASDPDDDAMCAARMADASGYVSKQIGGSDLIAAIRKVAAGQSLFDPSISIALLERLQSEPPSYPWIERLTSNERLILDMIGEGYTNIQMARQLSLAEKTVKNYVSSVLQKLGVNNRTQAALAVVDIGKLGPKSQRRSAVS